MSPRSRSRRGKVPFSGEHADPATPAGPGTTDDALDAREARQAGGRKRPGPGRPVGDTTGAGARSRPTTEPAVEPVEPTSPADPVDPAGPG